MTNNNKNEHPYALFIWRNRLPVLKKRRVDRKQYCFQNNHIPDFCVHYSLALFFRFFKTVLLLALYPPDKTLFTLALLGELYRNGIMLNIWGTFFFLSAFAFEIHSDRCAVTVAHVPALLQRITLCGSPLCILPFSTFLSLLAFGKQCAVLC